MFRRILGGLKAVSLAIGNVVGRIVLTALYFILLPPFALWSQRRLDMLSTKRTEGARWVTRNEESEPPVTARQQH